MSKPKFKVGDIIEWDYIFEVIEVNSEQYILMVIDSPNRFYIGYIGYWSMGLVNNKAKLATNSRIYKILYSSSKVLAKYSDKCYNK